MSYKGLRNEVGGLGSIVGLKRLMSKAEKQHAAFPASVPLSLGLLWCPIPLSQQYRGSG